jgi:hypothetical protein
MALWVSENHEVVVGLKNGFRFLFSAPSTQLGHLFLFEGGIERVKKSCVCEWFNKAFDRALL